MESLTAWFGCFRRTKAFWALEPLLGDDLMANKKFDYPSEETLKKMDRKLAKTKGSASLPVDASPVDILKFQLCGQFIRYRREHDLTQRELAKLIGLSEARMSEILHYRHGRFTADHLMTYLTKIKPNLKIKVA